MVPSVTTCQWNHFPLRKTAEKHMSDMLTFENVNVNMQLEKINSLPPPRNNAGDEQDEHMPPVLVSDDADELLANTSPHLTRL